MKMLLKTVLAVGGLVITLITHPAAAQIPGAIWTSLSDGSEVNFNIYNARKTCF